MSQQIGLTPATEEAYNVLVGNANLAGHGAGEILSRMTPDSDRINLAGLPQIFDADFTSTGAGGDALRRTEDAVYDRYARTMDPEQEAARRRTDVTLATRGLPTGSRAWLKAQDQLGAMQDRARQDARDASVVAGNSLQSQLFGESVTNRQQAYNEQAAERAATMQRLAALIGISQGGVPSAASPQAAQMQIAPVDVAGIQQGAFGVKSANAASENQAKSQAAAAATAMAVAGASAAGF